MGLVVRLSPGTEPVVEIQTPDLEGLDAVLRSMRAQGVWSALKGAAREFADAPLAGIEAVEAVLPEAQVITDGATPVAGSGPQLDPAAAQQHVDEWNRLATERAIAKGDIPDPAAPVEPTADIVVAPKQSTPKCKTCGGPTTYGSGTGANGKWEAYFCAAGGRPHTSFINK